MRHSEAVKEIKKRNPKIRKNGGRIEAVFNEVVKQVGEGKLPAISGIMRENGYSESSSRCLKVVRTATWKQLMDSIPRDEIMNVFTDLISRENEDKRTRLEAAKELCKLLDFYPTKKFSIGNQAEKYILEVEPDNDDEEEDDDETDEEETNS
jgi:hypothetical protein